MDFANLDTASSVILLLVGLGVFLLGFKFLGDSIEKLSASKMRALFHKAAGNRFRERQLDCFTAQLVLSGLHRFRLGQRVSVSGRDISVSGLELTGIVLEGDESGLRTRLTLSDPAAGNI